MATVTSQPGAGEVDKLLVDALKQAGVSQSQLSRLTGVPQPQISRYVRGRASPSLAQLRRMLAALGLGVDLCLVDLNCQARLAARGAALLDVLLLVDALPRRSPHRAERPKTFRELISGG